MMLGPEHIMLIDPGGRGTRGPIRTLSTGGVLVATLAAILCAALAAQRLLVAILMPTVLVVVIVIVIKIGVCVKCGIRGGRRKYIILRPRI